MKRILFSLLFGAVFGVAIGFAGGIFAFPYLLPPPEVNEQITGRVDSQVVGNGRFIHANPADPLHYGRGGLTL